MVKELIVKLIDPNSANLFIIKHHYSRKYVRNSKIHFGVFYKSKLMGVMSFGCPLDKNRAIKLVKDTKWGAMLELNRMAFHNDLPKNSESRCLAYALRFLKKNYPQLKWIQTFADACQCGDGTIYRAVGMKLIDIKRNSSLRVLDNGVIVARKSLDDHSINGKYLSGVLKHKPLMGFQIKYIYFLDPSFERNLTKKPIPYDEIQRLNASMYKGIGGGSLNEKRLTSS